VLYRSNLACGDVKCIVLPVKSHHLLRWRALIWRLPSITTRAQTLLPNRSCRRVCLRRTRGKVSARNGRKASETWPGAAQWPKGMFDQGYARVVTSFVGSVLRSPITRVSPTIAERANGSASVKGAVRHVSVVRGCTLWSFVAAIMCMWLQAARSAALTDRCSQRYHGTEAVGPLAGMATDAAVSAEVLDRPPPILRPIWNRAAVHNAASLLRRPNCRPHKGNSTGACNRRAIGRPRTVKQYVCRRYKHNRLVAASLGAAGSEALLAVQRIEGR